MKILGQLNAELWVWGFPGLAPSDNPKLQSAASPKVRDAAATQSPLLLGVVVGSGFGAVLKA